MAGIQQVLFDCSVSMSMPQPAAGVAVKGRLVLAVCQAKQGRRAMFADDETDEREQFGD